METKNQPALSPPAQEVLDYLDRERVGMSFKGLLTVMPHLTMSDMNAAVQKLYDTGRINRLEVMGPERTFPVFYSLFLSTAKRYTPKVEEPAPAAVNPVLPESVAALVAARPILTLPRAPEPEPAPAPVVAPAVLSPDEAVAVLERSGWDAQPEVVEERRIAVDRRRLTHLEVIKRWRLPFPLARVVEIIGESRKGGLTRVDTAIAIKMLREQVREVAE